MTSSAIAALLLHGGCTAHSHFKIPIPINESSTCNIKRDQNLYDVLKQTKLIIWDEASMQHHHGPEALDHTLRDLFKTNGDMDAAKIDGVGDLSVNPMRL